MGANVGGVSRCRLLASSARHHLASPHHHQQQHDDEGGAEACRPAAMELLDSLHPHNLGLGLYRGAASRRLCSHGPTYASLACSIARSLGLTLACIDRRDSGRSLQLDSRPLLGEEYQLAHWRSVFQSLVWRAVRCAGHHHRPVRRAALLPLAPVPTTSERARELTRLTLPLVGTSGAID